MTITNSNIDDTLNQLYSNYANQCKKIAKEVWKLKQMEITIATFELHINDVSEKLRMKEKTL
jgi:ABC-type Fe3+-citrate transport system substrate-binding protein